MRSHWLNGLGISAALVLGACAGEGTAREGTVRESAAGGPATSGTCGPGQHVCVRCNGSGTFCAPRCPECAPPLAPRGEMLSLAAPATSSTRCDEAAL